VCSISQQPTNPNFSGQGYLTQVCGLRSDDLFSGSPRDAAHAVFTATASGTLVARSVEDVVHALDIDGELLVFYGGRRVARYHLDLQDVLTVFAPNTGLPVLNGEAQQTEAGNIGGGRRFGRVGQGARFVATGFGNRTDKGGTDLTNAAANLSLAGSLIAI
jgi:hypothetical protein